VGAARPAVAIGDALGRRPSMARRRARPARGLARTGRPGRGRDRRSLPAARWPSCATPWQNHHCYRGVTQRRGQNVTVLEGDDEWMSVDKLTSRVDPLETHPDLSMAASRVLLYDEVTGSSSVLPLIGLKGMHIEVTSRQLADGNWTATSAAAGIGRRPSNGCGDLRGDRLRLTGQHGRYPVRQRGAGLSRAVATLYSIHRAGRWSQARQRDRDAQIRSVLPRHIELLGTHVGPELTRCTHALDSPMAGSLAMPEATAAVCDARSVRLPMPALRDPRGPRASVVMACYTHEPFVLSAINSVLDRFEYRVR